MTNSTPIRTALLSVSDKTGLVDLAKRLLGHNIRLLSTGGSAKLLKSQGLEVTDVSDHTGFPEILDGRVKTLHPKIHAGILACPDLPEHRATMLEHDITMIDLVVVNLYPFAETLAKGAAFDESIEQIDVGGPTMIRAAAKNHHYVAVVTSPADYPLLLAQLDAHQGSTAALFRKNMAARAFAHTAHYDSMIASWFGSIQKQPFPEELTVGGTLKTFLRYGENPHQAAALYQFSGCKEGLPNATIHQGKPLSYNNINDANAALELVCEFSTPAAVIIKHANPCGVAIAETIADAYAKALACDPKSAFGGVIALNRPLDATTATQILQLFSEVVIAPAVTPEAATLFTSKPNIRLLTLPSFSPETTSPVVTSIRGGFLLQMRDVLGNHMHRDTEHGPLCVTEKTPDPSLLREMEFAFTVCKHVRSNAIVISTNGQAVGVGAGQMSRIDSVQIACEKYRVYKEKTGIATHPVVLASDAFFPFVDGIELAAAAGVTAIIQPSGSLRDKEVIERANALGLIVMHTKTRHFRH